MQNQAEPLTNPYRILIACTKEGNIQKAERAHGGAERKQNERLEEHVAIDNQTKVPRGREIHREPHLTSDFSYL
jgi:hypothetical protein